MPDNEMTDIQAHIARAGIHQALALEHIARELNKFNFRKKFDHESE